MSDDFKKPIFVGKVGKIPKSLHNINKHSVQDKTQISDTERTFQTIQNTNLSEPPERCLEEDSNQLKQTEKSDEDNIKAKKPEKILTYNEPAWSGLPKSDSIDFELEVLKSGVIIENINLMARKFWVFGRLPDCNIYLAHPTISRYHAILQFNGEPTETRSSGFYIYDLGSTHGTFLNKSRIKSNMYIKVHVGHMIKFGNSTRTFILKGPEDDLEPESELTVTELKQNRINEQKKREEELLHLKEMEEKRKEKELEDGIDWGMGEDADEETDLTENPYAATNNEELYLDDPKKTLRGFFEREGEELQYDVEERGIGQFICRVELPIENSNGRPIIAEAIVKGKKKEAVVQCALEACRILDRAGVLRQAKHESRKRKPRNWEEDDYCNSDDDEFFDRTGAVERKKQYRMKIHNAVKETVETYESLLKKEQDISSELASAQNELDAANKRIKMSEENSESSNIDSLDEFMNNLSDDVPDKQLLSRLNLRITKLKQDLANTVKLINIAKPAEISLFKSKITETTATSSRQNITAKLPLFGKRIKLKPYAKSSNSEPSPIDDDDEETEEIETETVAKTKEKTPKETKTQNIEDLEARKIEPEKQNVPDIVHKEDKITERFSDKLSATEDETDEISSNSKNSCTQISSNSAHTKDTTAEQNTTKLSISKCELKSSLDERNSLPKIIGPQKPDASDSGSSQDNTATFSKVASKKSRKRSNKKFEDYKMDDDTYSTWLPPENQKGDGKTALNEKFGY